MSCCRFFLGSIGFCALVFVGCLEKAKPSEKTADGKPTPVSSAVGIVEGTVVIEGDPALVIDAEAQKIPADCDQARVDYPPLFREGPGRTLADAFVAVTGYKGVAKEKKEPLPVEIKGCAFDSRTYALQLAQHLLVKSGDHRPDLPDLFGAKAKSTLIAMPNSNAVPVFHRGSGQYVLVDDMRIFAQATVLVVDYPTFDVTRLDGKFRIEGVPEGSAKLSAYLPAAKLEDSKQIEVRAGKVTTIKLKLHFDATQFKSARNSVSAPATSSSAKP
ncbi:MAG: hypothetical protein QM784_18605 [Polyangiaceae bacterium]